MLGLDDTDFLKDGAAAGSGAVRFYKPGSVYVSTEKSQWRALGAPRHDAQAGYCRALARLTATMGDAFTHPG